MTIVVRRVCELQPVWVCYDYPDDHSRIIWRTAEQHKAATGKEAAVGDHVWFEMCDDWCDGPSFSYAKEQRVRVRLAAS